METRRVARGRRREGIRGVGWFLLPFLVILSGACDENGGLQPPPLRFGQVGQVRIQVITPLGVGQGELEQSLVWRSGGSWQLDETIRYRGLEGDRTRKSSGADASSFASAYATFIAQVNEASGLRLFLPELDPTLQPACGIASSTVAVEIQDEPRRESVRWVRCGNGALSVLTPQGSGPDVNASRVVAAAITAHTSTQGSGYRSPYLGSLPFGTLDRGEDSGVALDRSLFFRPVTGVGGVPQAPESWAPFWANHTRGSLPLPEVDWSREMVLVAAVGLRNEAGDSVRVQRVLQTSDGALVELLERVPGDFCSPAARRQYPFHIVVTPVTPSGIQFGEPRVQRIPCGL